MLHKSSLVHSTRNTHAVTLSIATQAIANSDLPNLEKIACNLEAGIRNHSLNRTDARKLLAKVRLAIAHRHFQFH